MENLLQANEISCRVQQISEKGLSLLLYVTSRDGQKRLDEKFGELGWQDRYEVIDGDLYCIISVWDSEKKMWISSRIRKIPQWHICLSRSSRSHRIILKTEMVAVLLIHLQKTPSI